MMATSRLAGHRCPNCDTLQCSSPLIKTRVKVGEAIRFVDCSHCTAKLWIKAGQGFAQTAVLLICVLFYYPMHEMLVLFLMHLIEPTGWANSLDGWAGPVMLGLVVGLVIYPLSTRVYKVGHTL
jgi:hypothetical protein